MVLLFFVLFGDLAGDNARAVGIFRGVDAFREARCVGGDGDLAGDNGRAVGILRGLVRVKGVEAFREACCVGGVGGCRDESSLSSWSSWSPSVGELLQATA
jgi:hypothetical protein